MYNDCAICLKQYFFKHRHEHLGIKQGKNVEENIKFLTEGKGTYPYSLCDDAWNMKK